MNYLTCELLDAHADLMGDLMSPKTSGSWFVLKVDNNKRFLGKKGVI